MIINNKKKTCWIIKFAVSADHRVKVKKKKNEKKDKYFDLAK